MTWTLAQAVAAPGTKTETRTIVETFLREVPLLSYLPFMDIGGLTHTFTREKTLPDPAYRQIDPTTPTEMVGQLEQITDTLKPLQGDITIDNMIVAGAQQGVQSQLLMGTVAAAHLWQRKFFKGNSQTTIADIDGLQYRIRSNQTIAVKSSPTNGGDPLSLAALDQAIDACKNPTLICMNKNLLRRISAFMRVSTNYQMQYNIEMAGTRVASWNGVPILGVAGRTPTEEVLAFDELGNTGSTATATSIYILSAGIGRLCGIRNGLPTMRPLGEMATKTAHKWRIDWFNNYSIMDEWSAVRLNGISDATVIA